ncbi:MAG: nitroreductase [Anaerolineales bacterium]|nr:nitroreductase [Anaerolineales bacterium]NUQ85414.1 nitroreductase [Anaerolineales bacterium]
MELFEAIHGRQSQGKVKPDAVPRETIEKLLSAAVQAPNHYKVRPWRFVVLTGEGRNRLGDVMAASQRDRQPDLPQVAFDKIRSLPLRAPVVIAVGVDKPSEEKVVEIENVCAAAAACQNILLAAQALGLGAKWRTGEWARDPKVKEFLGFAPDQHLIAFLYIGYPEFTLEPRERPSFEDRTVWVEGK